DRISDPGSGFNGGGNGSAGAGSGSGGGGGGGGGGNKGNGNNKPPLPPCDGSAGQVAGVNCIETVVVTATPRPDVSIPLALIVTPADMNGLSCRPASSFAARVANFADDVSTTASVV